MYVDPRVFLRFMLSAPMVDDLFSLFAGRRSAMASWTNIEDPEMSLHAHEFEIEGVSPWWLTPRQYPTELSATSLTFRTTGSPLSSLD
jgi:hypothetical protein